MRYTIETRCPNVDCDFVLKRLPITNSPSVYNSKTDMSFISHISFRFKCPQCQTHFDVIGKEEEVNEKILLARGDKGTLFGVSCTISKY
jgi:hypothetical protein